MFRGSSEGGPPPPEDLRPCTCSHEGIWQPDPVGGIISRRRNCWRRISTRTGCSSMWSTARSRPCLPLFWGQTPPTPPLRTASGWTIPCPYGTVHRLASAGKHKGVASAVLDWSMEHCQSLRADTHADNKIMQHLLEKNGFTRCGVIQRETPPPLSTHQHPPPPLEKEKKQNHPLQSLPCRTAHAGFFFAPARSALRRSTVTERTKPRTVKSVLATNTDQRKNPMGTDLNANL